MTYPANLHPVTQRAEQLMQRLQVFRTGRRVRFTMLLSHVTHGLEYLSPGKDEDLFRLVKANQIQRRLRLA